MSHRDPDPAAVAVAATVKPWLARSGASVPQVTLTTSSRVMQPH